MPEAASPAGSRMMMRYDGRRQDELARQALTLRTATLAQARDLRAEQAALRADEEKLTAAAGRLQAQINPVRRS